ncbi:class I SAM-dependent methyltransferase [bacterium]|nr:class I SAM-dependent methyltransferase [bacterium]
MKKTPFLPNQKIDRKMSPIGSRKRSFQITKVKRSKDEARKTYNRLAGIYDVLSGPGERRLIVKGLRMLNPEAGEGILEIGFGTGYALARLAESVGTEGKVQGIDISERMLERSRKRLKSKGMLDRASLVRGDASSLPYGADSLDAVFASFTLELFDTSEIFTVLQECRRVLKPEGRIVVVGLSKEGGLGLVKRLYERLHQRFPAWLDCRPIRVAKFLEQAGFRIAVQDVDSLWGLGLETVRAFV